MRFSSKGTPYNDINITDDVMTSCEPSVSLAFPPVGWQRTVLQLAQSTTVCA